MAPRFADGIDVGGKRYVCLDRTAFGVEPKVESREKERSGRTRVGSSEGRGFWLARLVDEVRGGSDRRIALLQGIDGRSA
jgi:hypothetical protein